MAKKKIFQISNALTEGIEETISAANHFSGELRVDVIPIKRIEVDPENPRDFLLDFYDVQNGIEKTDANHKRKSEELESLQTLANSIREQGIINPVVVYKSGDKYRLIAGERRTLASILAGKNEIQAKILDGKPSLLKISLLQWIENIERTDLSLWERLKNLEKILHAYIAGKGISLDEVTITELADLLGCSKPHALNYKLVLLADEKLKQLISDNKIKNLEKAALLASISDLESQQKAIDACLMGASLKKLKIITDKRKSKPFRPGASKQLTKKGRQVITVNLGTTKNLSAAKALLAILLKDEKLAFLENHFKTMEWNDYQSLTEAFKFLLMKLEELHT